MTAHYLVDLFGNPVFPLLNSIIDVREPDGGQSVTNGCLVIRVPDFVQVSHPTNLGDLLTKKYSGLLAFYAGFGNISYDDLFDPANVDLTYPATKARVGQRSSIAIAPGGSLQSTLYVLPWTGAPPGPTVAVIIWETYDFVDTDPASGLLVREYREQMASLLVCEVSFDNGINWNAVTSEGVFNVPLLEQGVDFIIRFTNTSPNDVFLGSWAVIY
jgi:hypothetical protein